MRIEEINMIEETMTAMNRMVIGAIYIDYPVYLVHLEYKKKNDDPMFFIDWAITNFMKSQPKLDSMSVSKIIGMDYRLILYRIKNLKEEGMVIESSEGFKITGKGESYFFNEEEEVPYVNASSDFLIDGRDLSIMPNVFYDDKGYVTFDKNSIYSRNILNGADDKAIKTLLAKIEKMSYERKRSVGLPPESREFSSTDSPSQGLLRMYLVFSCDQNNRCYKDIVYSNQIVDLPSIKEIVDKSYFNDGLRFNYGYDDLDAEKLRNKVFSFSTNGLLYGTKKVQDYIKKNKRHISIGISVDGNKIKHDMQRVYPDGRGSYDDVMKNVPLWLSQFPNHGTKATFSHGDLPYLKDSIIHLWNIFNNGYFLYLINSTINSI